MTPLKSRLQAVLFDLDGTLVDSAHDLGGAADEMRVVRGLGPLPMAAYRPLAGAGARGMLGVAFGIGVDHPDFAGLREEFFDRYQARMLRETRAFPQIEQLLQAIVGRGLRWGVVTNKIARFTDPLARAMPLFADASAIISGDTTPHAKPHPAPLLEAARRMGLTPASCAYVGDDERDIVAGRAAGMRTVAAAYGYLGAEADAGRWQADAVIGAPLELLQWLDTA